MINYRHYFGFKREPFPQNMEIDDLYPFPALTHMAECFAYTVKIRMVHLITGAVGSGKSTSLRYACSKFHAAKYKIIFVIANTGSMIELLREISIAFDLEPRTNSISILMRDIRRAVKEIAGMKKVPILVIDECQLFRLNILALLPIEWVN